MADKLTRLTGNERLGQNRESEYLGCEDVDDGTEPILTIDGLWNGLVTLQRGKENKDVITFREKSVPGISQVRPWIVNATNRKTLRKLYGSVTADALVGKRVQLYIDHKVRDPQDGQYTDGLRIRAKIPPQQQSTVKCPECGEVVKPTKGMTPAQVLDYAASKLDGRRMCVACMAKLKAQQSAENTADNTAEKPAEEEANEADSTELL